MGIRTEEKLIVLARLVRRIIPSDIWKGNNYDQS